MDCPIENVVFGNESKKALTEIRRLTKNANWLSIAIAGSVLNDIFFKNGPIAVSHKIKTTDFKLMGDAMSATNPLLKRKVNDETLRMVLFNEKTITYKERTFWRCFYNETR